MALEVYLFAHGGVAKTTDYAPSAKTLQPIYKAKAAIHPPVSTV